MEVLSRETSKDGDNLIVIESIKKVYTHNDLINEIQNTQRQKIHIIEQSKRLKNEYDLIVQKEIDLQDMLTQAESSDFENIIE